MERSGTEKDVAVLRYIIKHYFQLDVLKVMCRALLKIKVLHDAIEEPFLSKWFHKEPLTSEEPSVSQKVICGERRFFRL